MQGARGGFTIIEVLIVLAVSGAIFISAVTIFQGKQGKTEFSQAMRDVESKIRSFVNDTNVNALPGSGKYRCDATSGRPVLTVFGSDTTGTNGDCIFLGRALQVVDNAGTGKIYAYGVLGRRAYISGGLPVSVTDLANANPEPAMGQVPCGSACDLTEEYDLPFGATIISARVSADSNAPPDADPETDLVGYYNSPQTVSQSGSPVLTTVGYKPFTSNQTTPTSNIEPTIRNNSGIYMQGWYICMQSGTSNEMARLVVTSSPAGVTTKLNYGTCS